jgi:Glycosyl transferase family 2
MTTTFISLCDQTIELDYPDHLSPSVIALFGDHSRREPSSPQHVVVIVNTGPSEYSIVLDKVLIGEKLFPPLLHEILLEQVMQSLIVDLDCAVAMHGASVAWQGKSILIVGPTGSGKTSLTGWFVANDFQFLSDELFLLPGTGKTTISASRPLVAKPGSEELIGLLSRDGGGNILRAGVNTVIGREPSADFDNLERQAALVIFPNFSAGSDLEFEFISPARTTMLLVQSNLNARNLADHGVAALTSFARIVPALRLTYGSFSQLDGVADELARLIVENDLSVVDLKAMTNAFQRPHAVIVSKPATTIVPAIAPTQRKIPEETVRKAPKKLTIGMATYDDYDGVYFSIQTIRLFHPEILDDVEFLVIDNNPEGPCAQALKDLEAWIPNYRYVPRNHLSGTSIRNCVFEEASGDIVLCMDCHILLAPGSLQELFRYCDSNPDSKDLLQGPMYYDDLTRLSTHFDPQWQEAMFGLFCASSPANDLSDAPFEIPMQGLGLFVCRRDAWPGFNPAFRGFGGEEGYIHEKFRQRGGRVLCLPFLRWLHRFNRPLGVPYPASMDDRIRNYYIGFQELGWDTGPITEHFSMILGRDNEAQVAATLKRLAEPTSPAAVVETNPVEPNAPKKLGVPEEAIRKTRKKLTIGMATYDDYDGVYFSVQAIRLFHPEILEDVEFLVIDNHPDSPCARPLKELETWIPNYRYVPKNHLSSTAIRNCVFEEASGDLVLCMDCHVLLAPGSLQRLIQYFDANPGCKDLLQGPLIYDDMTSLSTHFEPQWREGMFGTWSTAPEGADPNGPPFEIPMQGLGLFVCRRDVWPGFNPAFRGFGGEEGYIHEKFRQRGGRVICLPFLRWLHRFGRPLGVPYPIRWEDRVRNYHIGFREVGWDVEPMIEHFKMHLGKCSEAQSVADMIDRAGSSH